MRTIRAERNRKQRMDVSKLKTACSGRWFGKRKHLDKQQGLRYYCVAMNEIGKNNLRITKALGEPLMGQVSIST